jgi:murein DD-endopeptidase MepM/ murein hydrolase activator NlpD
MDKHISKLEKRVDITEKQLKQIAELQVKLAQQLSNLRDEVKIIKAAATLSDSESDTESPEDRNEEKALRKKEKNEKKERERIQKEERAKQEREEKEEKVRQEKEEKEKRKHEKKLKRQEELLSYPTLPRSSTAPVIARHSSHELLGTQESRDMRLNNLQQLVLEAEAKRGIIHAQTPRNGPQFAPSYLGSPPLPPSSSFDVAPPLPPRT